MKTQYKSEIKHFVPILGFIIIFLILFSIVYLSRETCGNNVCGDKENCWDCPKDCKCLEEEYCSIEDKKCTETVCGNGKCEPFENPYNCCLDCKCTIPAELCNIETKKCELQE